MINTENNESVLDVVQNKEFIKNIYSKIVNLENEVELKNLLSFAISEKMKERYDYRDIVRLSSDEMNLNNHQNQNYHSLRIFLQKLLIWTTTHVIYFGR